ncbi:Gfo/Idh/MocA family oxidoreductase [Christensenellaceae bacterium NSJ-44]|uniref:Gfo/Idh/MocA family oxidoreductase n=1 Tax=Luoshenia tenuis TaxID=2763654 RepID=A0A926HNZ2_9FIRM|nr:Gfo/Idh/MocA family oxidoreductase [Luoshenia tenuis]MBC8529671.1 Gfo/Idh/MocA family oxidoreductase [Luoshenia tenuis]
MAKVKPVKVGLIGSGAISYTYLTNLTNTFSIIDMVGCSDLIPERSKARSELFGIRQMTNEEILNDPEIEIVVNTTQITFHTEVTKMILDAGKNVYSEKMMGCSFEDAKANIEYAKSKGLLIGAAPDTYMGAAHQTARKLIDDGWIGDPIMAQAFVLRPNRPASLAAEPDRANFGGAGTTMPYDMGGYYINALLNLLGPVKRVSGYAGSRADRVYTNPMHPNFREPIKVYPGPTSIMGCLEFHNGCWGNLVVMGESYEKEIPRIEIYGTKGWISVPDPNMFGGYGNDVYITLSGNEGTFKMPFTHGYGDTDPSLPTTSGKPEPCYNSRRGIGVADMAWALRDGRTPRQSAEQALHAVEIVTSIEKSCRENVVCELTTKPAQPAALPCGFITGDDMEAALAF